MKTASIVVDLEALTTLGHGCSGCSRKQRCCCAHYDICISGPQMQRIVGYLPHVARYCPQLKTPDGFDNVFEQIGRDLLRVDSMDDGLCVFAYHQGRKTRCALHSTALDLNLPINAIKPETCLLWPLALSANAPFTLSVDEDAFQFKCNHPRSGQRTLDGSVRDIITTIFGQHFTHELEKALHKGVSPVQLVIDMKHPLI